MSLFAVSTTDLLTNGLLSSLSSLSLRGMSGLSGAVASSEGAVNVDADGTVVVADDGEGVSESLHEAMFERFRKLSPHSNGAGLGLAIVRRVARDHGGDVRFVLGRQCTVEITLPLLSEEQALNGLVQH